MRRRISAVLALTLLVGLMGACGSDDDPAVEGDAATTTTEAKAEPTAIALTFDGKAATASPATAKGGLITINYSNTSKDPAGFAIARLDDGKTVADVKAFDEANKDNENAPPPTFIKIQGGANAKPGGTATYTTAVEKGNFVIAVFPEGEGDPPPQYTAFEVTEGKAAELPETDASISATEYSYEIKGLKAGDNEITVKNTGGLPHIYVIFGLKPDGVLDKALEFEGEGPPPGTTEFNTDLSYMDPGKSGIAKVNLPAGKYGIVCFLDNAPGGKSGKPHFLLGMKQEFTVA